MTTTRTEGRAWDLRVGGIVSLAVHATAAVVIGLGLAHARSIPAPPALQVVDLDLSAPAESSPTAEVAVPAAPLERAATEQDPLPPSLPMGPLPPPAPPVAQDALQAASPVVVPAAPASTAPPEPAPAVADAPAAPAAAAPAAAAPAAAAPATAAPATAAPATAAPARSHESGGIGIEGPVSFRGQVRPVYPLGARRRGEEGRVALEAEVASDGHAAAVRILESSGHDELDRAARRAIERASFTPALEAGHAVAARARITIVFRLTH